MAGGWLAACKIRIENARLKREALCGEYRRTATVRSAAPVYVLILNKAKFVKFRFKSLKICKIRIFKRSLENKIGFKQLTFCRSSKFVPLFRTADYRSSTFVNFGFSEISHKSP